MFLTAFNDEESVFGVSIFRLIPLELMITDKALFKIPVFRVMAAGLLLQTRPPKPISNLCQPGPDPA
jgi:hypothetical protein